MQLMQRAKTIPSQMAIVVAMEDSWCNVEGFQERLETTESAGGDIRSRRGARIVCLYREPMIFLLQRV
jgi:hypothetical protein